MQDLTIGIVQTIQLWEDKEGNLKHFSALMEERFTGQQVDLILLPEMFNTGFSMNASGLAEKMDGPSVHWLVGQAEKFNTQLGATLIIEEGGKYYNRFVIVDKRKVLCHYDKRHLFRMAHEHDHFTAGESRTIHTIKDWKILLQVCYDLRFPVYSRNRFEQNELNYDMVVYLANWPAKRSYAWINLIQARSIENQSFSVGVNRVGVDGNNIPYSGDSAAYDPWGNPLVVCQKNNECVKILQLNRSILKDVRQKFPAYLDADS